MIEFQENAWTERRMEGRERRKDGQTLFCRTLPATARGPKKVWKNYPDDLQNSFKQNMKYFTLEKYKNKFTDIEKTSDANLK